MISTKGEENERLRVTRESAQATMLWHAVRIDIIVPPEGLSLAEVIRVVDSPNDRVWMILAAMGLPLEKAIQFAEIEVERAIRMVRVAKYVRDSKWDQWADKWISGEDKSVSVAWELGRSSWGIMQESAEAAVELFYAKKNIQSDPPFARSRVAWASTLAAKSTDGHIDQLHRLLAFLKENLPKETSEAKSDLTPRS
jgi:hypothetical protein